jgi:lipopolysaccharide export system protein LptC
MAISDVTARFEPGLDAETEVLQRRDRLAKQIAAVRRRSRRIRTLRFWIPAAMVILGGVNIGWIVVVSIINSFSLYSGVINEIRMTNPRFYGQTDKGDHYTVSGLVAVRMGADSPIFTMKSPSIEFRSANQGATHVQAASGIYNRDTQAVTLSGNVVLQSGNSDMVYRTERAVLDLTKSQISGDKHIDGIGSLGHITGESFLIADNGKTMQLHGRGDIKVFEQINNTHKH